jgi:hypothetical protein
MIDLTLWEPYLEAFTRMLRSIGDPVTAQRHRREMTAYIEASPDFWRGADLHDTACNRPRNTTTAWYKQGVAVDNHRKAHRRW